MFAGRGIICDWCIRIAQDKWVGALPVDIQLVVVTVYV